MGNIPLWEKQLLGDIKLHLTDKLLTFLTLQEPLYMCSDGGAVNTIGSFGAVIASATEILIELIRQAYGHTPQSFCPEAYGMLAYLRFLFHFMVYHNIKCDITPFMICDNSGLLHQVSTIATVPSPRRCLHSEADVELKILDTLKQLHANPTYIHVKSHPDSLILVKKLPWKSQLNVRCDDMTSSKLTTLDTKSTVTMFPARRVMLEINGATVTHHQSSQI